MTSAEALTRLRILLNEATPGGMWNDTQLYEMLDSAQNIKISSLLTEMSEARKLNPYYIPKDLEPLIKLDTTNTTTVGATEQEYSLPSDYIQTLRASYDYTGTGSGTLYEATNLAYEEVRKRENNVYRASKPVAPNYYIKGGKIGFYPQPIGAHANAYQHYYISLPTAVASGQNFTLLPNTHEELIQISYKLSKTKDQ